MSKIFYRKSTSIAFMAAMLILVLLVCMLLVELTQLADFNHRTEKLNKLIADVQAHKAELEELVEFLKTDTYVRQWAEEHGRINGDDITWLNTNVPKTNGN